MAEKKRVSRAKSVEVENSNEKHPPLIISAMNILVAFSKIYGVDEAASSYVVFAMQCYCNIFFAMIDCCDKIEYFKVEIYYLSNSCWLIVHENVPC